MAHGIRSDEVKSADDIQNIVDDTHARTNGTILERRFSTVLSVSSGIFQLTGHVGKFLPDEFVSICVEHRNRWHGLILEIMSSHADNLIIISGCQSKAYSSFARQWRNWG